MNRRLLSYSRIVRDLSNQLIEKQDIINYKAYKFFYVTVCLLFFVVGNGKIIDANYNRKDAGKENQSQVNEEFVENQQVQSENVESAEIYTDEPPERSPPPTRVSHNKSKLMYPKICMPEINA